MKTLNITFTDREFKKLFNRKPRAYNWHDFILQASVNFRDMKGGTDNGK